MKRLLGSTLKKKDAYIELVETYYRQGKTEQAIKMLDQAEVKVDSKNDVDILKKKKVELRKRIQNEQGLEEISNDVAKISDYSEKVATPVPTPDSVAVVTPTLEPVLSEIPSLTPATSDDSSIETPTFVEEPSNVDIDVVYDAYLDFVKKRQSTLDVNLANWDSSAPIVPRQTVAVLDVWGDDTPELLLAESKNPESIFNPMEPLAIYTFQNGKIKNLFERNVDAEYDIFEYEVIYTSNKQLFLYEVQGCDRGVGTWSRLLSEGDNSEKIVMTEVDGCEESGVLYDRYYDENDVEVSEEVFKKWKSELDSSVVGSIFASIKEYGAPIAMNYKEAIAYLSIESSNRNSKDENVAVTVIPTVTDSLTLSPTPVFVSNDDVDEAYMKQLKKICKKYMEENGAEDIQFDYVLKDIDGDGIHEAIFSRYRTGTFIYSYEDGKVKELLSEGNHVVDEMIFYPEQKSFIHISRYHGGERYEYYYIKKGKYVMIAAKARQVDSDDTWSCFDENDEEISEKAFDKKVNKLLKGSPVAVSFEEFTTYYYP